MNLIQVYKKSMQEQIRDYKALLLTLMSPIVFIVIFGLAFGQGFYTYNVAVTNADKGVLGQEFIQNLKDGVYSNGNQVFVVVEAPDQDDQIQDALKNRQFHAHLFIPEDFSHKIQNGMSTQQTEIKVTGDPAFAMFSLTEITLENYINTYLKAKSDTTDPVIISNYYINETIVNSEFDSMAPGLIMISVTFLLVLSAMVLTREAENGTLQRLLLSRLKSWELFAGITLSQMTVAVFMVPLVMASTFILGFRSNGSILLTFCIGCLAALSAIGIGLIISAFSRNGLDAFIIGNIVITPLFFLSILPLPNVRKLSLAGMDLSIFSLLPSLSATSAANKVLVNNGGFLDILPDLVLLIIPTIVYWCVGVFLFNRKYRLNR